MAESTSPSRVGSACLQIQAGSTCQNDCLFCTDVGLRGNARVVGDTVREILAHGAGLPEALFSRLEPTLEGELARWARWAVELGFPRISVVTNGRRLARRDLAARLVEAGINSFVVSLHGPSPAVHDGLTRRPGSFADTVAGLEDLCRLREETDLQLRIVTTACAPNLEHLPELQSFVAQYTPDGHGWNALLLTGRALEHADVLAVGYPRLVEMLAHCIAEQPEATGGLSHVPFCLCYGRVPLRHLPRAEHTFMAPVDRQGALVDPAPEKLQRPHAYHPRCEDCALRHCCQGLSPHYVERFGWEGVEPLDPGLLDELTAASPDPVRPEPLVSARELQRLITSPGGQWEVVETRVGPTEAVVHLRAHRPDELTVRLVLTARDDDGAAFRRTRDYNVALQGQGYSRRERAMAGALVEWICRREAEGSP